MTKDEPVMIASLVAAVLSALAAFGVSISADQQKAVMTLLAAAVPIIILVAGWVARSKVTPWNNGSPKSVS